MKVLITILLLLIWGIVPAQDVLSPLVDNSIVVWKYFYKNPDYILIDQGKAKGVHSKNRRARHRCTTPGYYEKLGNGFYLQREKETTVINWEAPMQLFSKYANPTHYLTFRNEKIGNEHQSDYVTIYLYLYRVRANKNKIRLKTPLRRKHKLNRCYEF